MSGIPEREVWDEVTKPQDVEVLAMGRRRPCIVVVTGVHAGESFAIEPRGLTVGRGVATDIQLVGDAVSRTHCVFRVDRERVIVEDTNSTNGTFLNGRRIRVAELREGDKIAISDAVLRFGYQDAIDTSFQRRLYDSAMRDDLTSWFNRRYFRDRLDAEYAFCRRHALPLSLILIDIDHFKRINDTWGHDVGDIALRAFARAAEGVARRDDLLGRIGGDELAVCARMTSAKPAHSLSERLRRAAAAIRLRARGQPVPVTVSIGIASMPNLDVASAAELVTAADRALYRAKQGGRDRVVPAQRAAFGDVQTRAD